MCPCLWAFWKAVRSYCTTRRAASWILHMRYDHVQGSFEEPSMWFSKLCSMGPGQNAPCDDKRCIWGATCGVLLVFRAEHGPNWTVLCFAGQCVDVVITAKCHGLRNVLHKLMPILSTSTACIMQNSRIFTEQRPKICCDNQ